MKRKRIRSVLLLFPFLLLCGTGKAQQLTHYSQYMFNPYYNNPAVAGSDETSFASLAYRSQWAGFQGAPTTSVASFSTPFKEQVGLGGLLFTDRNGPFRRSGLRLSYAYHLQLAEETRLGFGLGGVLYQHSLNKEALDPEVDGDPTLMGDTRNSYDPDASFGVFLNGKKYFLSASASHLFESRILGDSLEGTNLARHYFVGGGYMFDLGEKWDLEPSLILRNTQAAPLHYDVNAKLLYNELVWAGISYRSNKTALAMLGLRKGQLRIGYSYDISFSDIRHYSSGSHEIHLGMRIPRGESVDFPF